MGTSVISRDGEIWLSRKEAASYLTSIGCPIAPATLANLASDGNKRGGPAFTRTRDRMVRYLQADLDAWVAENTKRFT